MKNNNRLRLPYILAILLIFGAFINTDLFAEATVFERVRKVEDPELAGLIAIAIKNLPESKLIGRDKDKQKIYEAEIAKSKAIRIVTEKYAQIKLLDKKIELIEGKTKSDSNQVVKSEFMIAKSTLESERLACIAQLREALNLVPWIPLGPKKINQLSTWIHLEMLENDTVRILNFRKPFSENIYKNSSSGSYFKTPQETIKYIEDITRNKDILPVRITFAATEKAAVHTHDLNDKTISIIHKNNVEYKTDLSQNVLIIPKREYVIGWIHNGIIKDYSRRITYSSNENYVNQIKLQLQNNPFTLPMTLFIKLTDIAYDEKTKSLEREVKEMIKDLKLTDYVTIKMTNNLNNSISLD